MGSLRHLKNIIIVTSKNTESQVTLTNINNETVKYCEHYWTVTQSNAVGKMAPTDLLTTGLPQTFNLWKTGTSLAVQWPRLRAPNAKGLGLIPGQGTRSCIPQLKIPCAATKIGNLCATAKTQCNQISQ